MLRIVWSQYVMEETPAIGNIKSHAGRLYHVSLRNPHLLECALLHMGAFYIVGFISNHELLHMDKFSSLT